MATVHNRTIQSIDGTKDFIFLCVSPSEVSPRTTELQAFTAIDDEINNYYGDPEYSVYEEGYCLENINEFFETDAPLISWYWYWLVKNMPFIKIIVKTR